MRAALAATAALAALVLAGCGDEPDSTTTSTAFTATTSATTTPAEPEATAPVAPDDSAGDPAAADDPGADRPRSVEDVIDAVLTASEKPEVICDDLATASYVRAAYGDRGGCIAAQRPGALADSVEITSENQSGRTASAVVVPTGGPYNGVDVEVHLVAATDLAGAWQIDSLRANVPAGP